MVQDLKWEILYSFTGSYAVGKWLKENTGLKSVSLELGNNSPNIIHKDADLDLAASSCVKWGYANAGQTCISVQRIYVHEDIYEQFKAKAVEITKNLKVGNPLDESTDMGPMISASELDRIEEWVKEAVSAGANVLIGGKREDNIYYPTILENVNNEMKVVCQETFAPILTLIKYNNIDEVIAEANNSDYGLQSAVFTKDIDVAFYVANKLKTGGVIVNDGSTYRADLMPYGGIKNSGTGKEGPKYAIKEMTYMKPIVINLTY
ncbi:aldehyde dehydrogenase family protein [Butyricicoccus sp. 1XD8-22]|nr:aldehyde dehydrogenase family protein [Butyricicoccus sp. 1XD8-22]